MRQQIDTSASDPSFSLQKEISKRKTAVMQGVITNNAVKRGTGRTTPAPTVQTSSQKQVDISLKEPKRATQTNTAVVTHLSALNVLKQKKPILIIVCATISILVIIGIVVFSVAKGADDNTEAQMVLPTTPIDLAIAYLQKNGIQIDYLDNISDPVFSWHSPEQRRVVAQDKAVRGTFILLSYTSSEEALTGAYLVEGNKKYQNWHIIPAANILLLSDPKTDTTIYGAVASHLTQFLIAPYRSYLSTATPTARP